MRRISAILLTLVLCVSSTSASIGQTSDKTQPTSTSQTMGVGLLEARTAAPLSMSEEHAVRPGDVFKECEACPEMVVVPAGEFVMGSPESEESSEENERPQHKVTILNPFSVGRFAVTFDEWDACVAVGGCRGYRPSDRGWGRGRRPVINSWWEDANSFVNWLSEKTKEALPAPERGGARIRCPSGHHDTVLVGLIPLDGQSQLRWRPCLSVCRWSEGRISSETLPVDSLSRIRGVSIRCMAMFTNYLGLLAQKLRRSALRRLQPETSVDCDRHVLRGGSWNFASWHLRAASRGAVASAVNLLPVSLRVARTLRR